jgi:hypothetical protein
MSVAVGFLARGGEGAQDAVRAFVRSYKEMPAEYPHDLIVMVKGWSAADGDIAAIFAGIDHLIIELPDDGFDWGAYMRTARQLDHEWIVFFNTHTRLASTGWLRKMMDAAGESVGIVGATASWGSVYTPLMAAWPAVMFTYRNRGLFKACVGAGLRIGEFLIWALPLRISFAPAPNPHVRSNGFLMRRQLFCDYADTVKIPLSKHAAYKLESGRRGLTRYVMSRGLRPVIAGADGRAYQIPDWPLSRTFQNPDQSNLLISDNQTRLYAQSSDEQRKLMEGAAWYGFRPADSR